MLRWAGSARPLRRRGADEIRLLVVGEAALVGGGSLFALGFTGCTSDTVATGCR